MRRGGEAGTARLREAMQRAGYEKPKPREALSLKRPERSIDMPWPGTRTTPRHMTIAIIARDVAHRHGLTVEDLCCPCRFRAFVRARQEAFYLARHLAEASLPAIGRFFGGRDHGTVMYGIQQHKKRRRL